MKNLDFESNNIKSCSFHKNTMHLKSEKFGRVTHLLDATAMWVRSLFYLIVTSQLVVLGDRKRIYVVPFTWVSLIEISAMINLY